MRRQPIICIVASHSPMLKLNHPDRTTTHISDEISQAVSDNGGIAIGLLPPTPEICFLERGPDGFTIVTPGGKRKPAPPGTDLPLAEMADPAYMFRLLSRLRLCDGIIFQGGIQVEKYAYHFAKLAYQYRIPTLGFCSGQSIMTGIFDGTEIIDVDSTIHCHHHAPYVHDVQVVPDSGFYDIVQCDKLQVNSRHKYAVKSCPELHAAAIYSGSDGTHIEVLEARDRDQFYLSTRFHPESLYRKDPTVRKIFTAFIRAAHEYQNSPNHLSLTLH